MERFNVLYQKLNEFSYFSFKVFKNQFISIEYLALKTPFAGNFWVLFFSLFSF